MWNWTILSKSNEIPVTSVKNPTDCIVLGKWVFENFVLADKLFSKALWGFETCVLLNNNLCGNLVSSL